MKSFKGMLCNIFMIVDILFFFNSKIFAQCVTDYYSTFVSDTIVIEPLKNDTFSNCNVETINIISNPILGNIQQINNTLNYISYYVGKDSIQYSVICNQITYKGWIYVVITPLPDNVYDVECTVKPLGNNFEITPLFSYPGVNSMSTPMVADLDGDGIPEIIACKNTSESPYFSNDFYILDGQTGSLKYTLQTVKYETHGQAISIADVDRDGYAEIFITGYDMYIYCYNYNGGIRWKSNNMIDKKYLLSTTDINNDGLVELVSGPYIYNASNGKLLLQGIMEADGQGFGSPHNYHCYQPSRAGREYYMYALFDIDQDGTLEICAGNSIYKLAINNVNDTQGNTWNLLRQAQTNTNILFYDGQTIVLDFDNDGDVDICVLGRSKDFTNNTFYNYIWDGQTSEIIAYNVIVEQNWGGQSTPFAGDLDGNSYPEIVFTSTNKMYALTYDTNYVGNIKIMHAYQPFNETAGFTLFDFNQDNKIEIVFRNTTQLFIADGVTLNNLCNPITSYSGTITEYPVVADVNADGMAEIIITHANQPWNGYNSNGNLSVFASTQNQKWSSARKVWNQWSYNAVNINEDLTVPQYLFDIATIFPNGKKVFNGFLQQMPLVNTNGDLYVSITDVAILNDICKIKNNCDSIELTIFFENKGDIALKKPYEITVYRDYYKGDILYVDTLYTDLLRKNIDSIKIDMKAINLDEISYLVFAINDEGIGVAQTGNQQEECDTINNIYILSTLLFNRNDTIQYFDTINEGEIYNNYGFYIPSDSTNYKNITKQKWNTHINKCDTLVILHLHIIMDSLFVSAKASPPVICQYESSILFVDTVSNSQGKLSFLWTPNDSLNTDDDSIVVSKAMKTTVYTVLVIDEHGRKGEAQLELIVHPIPTLELGGEIGICNDSLYPILLSPCDENYTFQWNTGDTSKNIHVYKAGKYIVNARNHFNCTSKDSVNVIDVNNLIVRIVSLTDFCDNLNTILSANTQASHFRWSTGDTTQKIRIEKPGLYTVNVMKLGCYASDFIVIDSCLIRLFFPNAITPSDHNNVNDYLSLLLPEGYEITNFKIKIYDRWGNLIFVSNDIDFKWYGTALNGKISPNTLFCYVVTFEKFGKLYTFKGSVLVL
ncbi:MAG: FG-GAP-like repeat-containing protein [Bacteroidales bacterium]